eukprot:COSAG01_NODE_206_length_22034_cov_125.512585_1_plen_255_part_10
MSKGDVSLVDSAGVVAVHCQADGSLGGRDRESSRQCCVYVSSAACHASESYPGTAPQLPLLCACASTSSAAPSDSTSPCLMASSPNNSWVVHTHTHTHTHARPRPTHCHRPAKGRSAPISPSGACVHVSLSPPPSPLSLSLSLSLFLCVCVRARVRVLLLAVGSCCWWHLQLGKLGLLGHVGGAQTAQLPLDGCRLCRRGRGVAAALCCRSELPHAPGHQHARGEVARLLCRHSLLLLPPNPLLRLLLLFLLFLL